MFEMVRLFAQFSTEGQEELTPRSLAALLTAPFIKHLLINLSEQLLTELSLQQALVELISLKRCQGDLFGHNGLTAGPSQTLVYRTGGCYSYGLL